MVNLPDVVQDFGGFGMVRTECLFDGRQRSLVEFESAIESIALSIEIRQVVVVQTELVVLLVAAERIVDDLNRSLVVLFGAIVIGSFLQHQAHRVENFGHFDMAGPVRLLEKGQRFFVRRFGCLEITLLKRSEARKRHRSSLSNIDASQFFTLR